MLVAIVMIVCIVLWLTIQKSLADQGVDPLSRGQLRYMRKRARKEGVDISQINYNPRRGTNPFPKTKEQREIDKIVRDLERARSGKQPRKRR